MSHYRDQNLKKTQTFLDQIYTKFNDFVVQEHENDVKPILDKAHQAIREASQAVTHLTNAGNETPVPKVEDLPVQEGSRIESKGASATNK